MMQQHYITELDLQDVPQVYHNLKYNDGEIYFADNITSIPGLMKQFKVNFIAYVMVTEGRLTVDMNNITYHLEKNCSLFVDRKMVIENVKHTENFSCVICAMRPESSSLSVNMSSVTDTVSFSFTMGSTPFSSITRIQFS